MHRSPLRGLKEKVNSITLSSGERATPSCFCYNKAVEEYEIKFQDGLLKDGRNGLTVEEAIAQIAKRIWFYNSKVPCKENEQAIVALNDALYYLEQRTKDRKERGVEETYEV